MIMNMDAILLWFYNTTGESKITVQQLVVLFDYSSKQCLLENKEHINKCQVTCPVVNDSADLYINREFNSTLSLIDKLFI